MKRILHILTRENDPTAAEVISQQRAQAEWEIAIVDLNESNPDYASLLEKVFAADSVAVW